MGIAAEWYTWVHTWSLILALMRMQVGASLPMYGVCCYVDEILHRPPLLAREK